jgi:hypothetical protein
MTTTLAPEQLDPADEAAVDAIVTTIAHHLRNEHPRPSKKDPALRDAHPKHHGCVEATIEIEQNLPDELRQGVFAGRGPYKAWVRFSNAFKSRPDLDIDARGMAIKIMGISNADGDLAEETQDFLLVTNKAFFARNPADFVDFPAAVAGPKTMMARSSRVFGFFFGVKPFRFRLPGFLALLRSMRWPTSPLVQKYFSQTPYRFGPTAAKFRARPRQHGLPHQWVWLWIRVAIYLVSALFRYKLTRWDNYLRDALLGYLQRREAVFDFEVQRRRDGMPLDDAVVAWSSLESPYRKVATIRIPRQSLDLPTMMLFGQHVSYTPWHTVHHQPLGSINVARRRVYEAISSLRHELNEVERREPLPGESQAAYLSRIGASHRPVARA